MRPTLVEVVARIPGGTEDAVRPLYDAAWAEQCIQCCVDPYGPDLAHALIRRVKRLWAAQGHTLGVLDTGGDFGPQYILRLDWLIEEAEGPHRRIPVA